MEGECKRNSFLYFIIAFFIISKNPRLAQSVFLMLLGSFNALGCYYSLAFKNAD